MPGTVVMLRNPFRLEDDREVIAVAKPVSIRAWLDEKEIGEFLHPTICLRNGAPVLRERWTDTLIGEDDLVVFVPLLQDGGGGKNPLRIVLMIALMVAAPHIGALIGSAVGLTGTAFTIAGQAVTWGSILGAGVALAGSVLINVLIPPPKPSVPTFGPSQAPSPTYSLQAQGNQARLLQPIPVVYGRHRVFPDLAAAPWAEYRNNDQYLHQLHCIGQGTYDLEQIRIEDTPISSFEEIETELVSPGGTVTLFETDVVAAPEVAGQELIGVNQREEGEEGWIGPFVANPAGTRATQIGIDVVMPRGLYYATDDDSLQARTVTWEVEARVLDDNGQPVGAGTWTALSADVNIAATDIAATAGDNAFDASATDFLDEGVKVGRRIAVSGFSTEANNGTWTVASVTASRITVSEAGIVDETAGASVTIAASGEYHVAATSTAIRLSFGYPVAAGRYEVRARRTNNKSTDSRTGHELRWAGLKTFLEDAPEFGNVTLLAVRMRATDNLSQRAARMINCIVTRKIPVWDPETGWSEPRATRSLASAFADAARSRYGAGLDDARIDLAALHALDRVWQSRGDRFDGVFNQGLTVWEALTRIARCGRALPYLQGGVLRIVRDAPRTLPVALFGPRNIVKGSFRVQYVMPGEDTADAVTVTYFSERTWAPDEVVAALPDSATEAADKPATVELFGCTGPEQAMREGLYMAAANRYRRRIMTFRTELEGLIPTYGDLIAITHDLPRWGQGGEVVEVDGRTLTLSEPLEWESGEEAAEGTGADTPEPPAHYLALRKRDGSLSGPWPVSPGADERSVVLSEDLEFEPYTGADEERTHFAFGAGEAWGLRARVLAVRPRGEQVEITAVGEDARVHEADLAA